MKRSTFDGIPHFLAVARSGSFSAGAQALGVSPTAISKAVSLLEARHGAKLFQRTTRQVALTEAGAELFATLDRSTNEIENALSSLGNFQLVPSGNLRLTVPHMIMATLIEPLLEEFISLYPRVRIDVSLNDELVDLIAQNFDAGIRLGEAIDRDMIVVRLTGTVRWGIAATPSYWDRCGRPDSFEGLTRHQAILYRFPGSRQIQLWEFLRDGKSVQLNLPAAIVVDDRASLIRLAKQGLGAAFVQELEVAPELERRALELRYGESIATDDGIFLYFPSAMQSQPKLRAFIDLIKKRLRSTPAKI